MYNATVILLKNKDNWSLIIKVGSNSDGPYTSCNTLRIRIYQIRLYKKYALVDTKDIAYFRASLEKLFKLYEYLFRGKKFEYIITLSINYYKQKIFD